MSLINNKVYKLNSYLVRICAGIFLLLLVTSVYAKQFGFCYPENDYVSPFFYSPSNIIITSYKVSMPVFWWEYKPYGLLTRTAEVFSGGAPNKNGYMSTSYGEPSKVTIDEKNPGGVFMRGSYNSSAFFWEFEGTFDQYGIAKRATITYSRGLIKEKTFFTCNRGSTEFTEFRFAHNLPPAANIEPVFNNDKQKLELSYGIAPKQKGSCVLRENDATAKKVLTWEYLDGKANISIDIPGTGTLSGLRGVLHIDDDKNRKQEISPRSITYYIDEYGFFNGLITSIHGRDANLGYWQLKFDGMEKRTPSSEMDENKQIHELLRGMVAAVSHGSDSLKIIDINDDSRIELTKPWVLTVNSEDKLEYNGTVLPRQWDRPGYASGERKGDQVYFLSCTIEGAYPWRGGNYYHKVYDDSVEQKKPVVEEHKNERAVAPVEAAPANLDVDEGGEDVSEENSKYGLRQRKPPKTKPQDF